MIADGLEELHELAMNLGLDRKAFMPYAVIPHYQLPARMREGAIACGALEISPQRWEAKLRQLHSRGSSTERQRQGRKRRPTRSQRPSGPVAPPTQASLL